jgi:HCOMODA/2-hydroxy-3-carboxy-muconic semialdehyde decarboxylase
MNDSTRPSSRAAGILSASVASVDRDLIDDLVAANRTLASLNVLDAFGHVSVRDPKNPKRYLISRSIAPESVVASDILALDLDSQAVHPDDRDKLLYRERFIHGEIYKVRPDVNAVVHSHSPTVVPFTVTKAKLRPLLHNAGFLGLGAPLFEIRKCAGHGTDLMILTPALGKDLAKKLGKEAAVVLMRGHGNSVVAPSLPNAVFRAYYTEVNARQQLAAITIGGPINFMSRAEAMTSSDAMLRASARPWALWRKKALRELEA